MDIPREVRVLTSTPKVHVKTYVEKKGFDSSKLDDMDISPEVRVETRVLKGLDTEGQKDHPKNVPQNVKALRDAYDKHYNETATTTSVSVAHKRDGKTILKYKTPLPLEEVDEKYPRDEWIQMLLDEEITIDNFKNIVHIY